MIELGLHPEFNGGKEEQIARTMKDLLTNLPEGAAKLSFTHDSGGKIWYLTPSNKKAAGFGIHFDGTVDAFFGLGNTAFELPYESGLPKDADFAAVLEWAKATGLAVITGKCKERFGFLSICGTIWVNGKLYGVRNFFHLRLYPKTLHYAPYLKADG